MSTVPALPPGQSKAMTSGTTQVVLDQNLPTTCSTRWSTVRLWRR